MRSSPAPRSSAAMTTRKPSRPCAKRPDESRSSTKLFWRAAGTCPKRLLVKSQDRMSVLDRQVASRHAVIKLCNEAAFMDERITIANGPDACTPEPRPTRRRSEERRVGKEGGWERWG